MLGRGGVWTTKLNSTVTTVVDTLLRGKYVRSTRFISVGAGTSGTATLPSASTVVLDDFGGTVDAVVLQISGGKPTQKAALTAGGVVVTTSFDAAGNYVLSAAPSAYPVAVVYKVQQTWADFDDTAADIWTAPEYHDVLAAANGGTGQSSFTVGDIVYASATNVLSKLAANATATKKFLSMTSSVPSYAQPAFTDVTGTALETQGGTGQTTYTTGDLLRATAANTLGKLAKGTAYQILRMNSGATDLEWGVPSNLTGTLTTMRATTGIAGQAFFCTTYNSWFDWIVDRWFPRQPDPRYGFMHREKFMGATVAASFPFGNNSTGSGNALDGAPATDQLGALILECTNSGETANIRTSLTQFLTGSLDLYMEAILKIPTLSDATDTINVLMGMNDNASFETSGLPTDGIFASFKSTINGAKMIMNTSSNSTRTATNSTGANIVANTWFRPEIYVNGSTAANFYLNGVSQGSVATNLPTGAGRYSGFQIKLDKSGAGASARQVYIDSILIYGYYSAAKCA